MNFFGKRVSKNVKKNTKKSTTKSAQNCAGEFFLVGIGAAGNFFLNLLANLLNWTLCYLAPQTNFFFTLAGENGLQKKGRADHIPGGGVGVEFFL